MQIVLTTFNGRYTHSSIALRYLQANLKELEKSSKILEFVINEQVQTIAEKILDETPKIVGIGAYIWNAKEVEELIHIIKQVSPETLIVLGGPEASHQPFRMDFQQADYIIQGEGEIAFYELCRDLLSGNSPKEKIIKAPLVNLEEISMPYSHYSDHDVENRVIYVEASRGCPFSCEFCLSSIDKRVRNFDLDLFLKEIHTLWERGVRNFKFIDRTFNLNISFAIKLIDFFLEKEPPYMVHFEVIPDNFPEKLKEKIKLFPPTTLQLEIGIQTMESEIAKNINRNLNIPKIEENIKFLERETNAHIHLDLIVGLPGESLEQFGRNLNALTNISRSEIQIGILKKLSGTTLNRHDREFSMSYSDKPPYDILKNNKLSFKDIQNMKRFARFWDLVYNSGNFKESSLLIWSDDKDTYTHFKKFSQYIYQITESTWKISLDRLAEYLFTFLIQEKKLEKAVVGKTMARDFRNRRRIPNFLREYRVEEEVCVQTTTKKLNKRQLKHAGEGSE